VRYALLDVISSAVYDSILTPSLALFTVLHRVEEGFKTYWILRHAGFSDDIARHAACQHPLDTALAVGVCEAHKGSGLNATKAAKAHLPNLSPLCCDAK
jgi:hypothetical protein